MMDIVPGTAVSILRADHGQIKQLLTRLKMVDNSEQDHVLSDLFLDLRVHSALEQQLFYPTISKFVGREKTAGSGKDFYLMLALMLELESCSRAKEPLSNTLKDLCDRFEQHVDKDEGLFSQLDKDTDEWNNQTTSLADKMQSYRTELREKLTRDLSFDVEKVDRFRIRHYAPKMRTERPAC